MQLVLSSWSHLVAELLVVLDPLENKLVVQANGLEVFERSTIEGCRPLMSNSNMRQAASLEPMERKFW